MLRTLFFYVYFWLHQFGILPNRLLVYLLRGLGREEAARKHAGRVAQFWGRSLMALSGAKVKVHGKWPLPPGQAALVVSNHQGAFDIPLQLAYLGSPVGFVAKIELRRVPLLGFWMEASGCTFLKRGDKRQSVEVVKQSIRHLQEGVSMVIYPEGTRSGGNHMAKFKKGSVNIAFKAEAPIIPVALRGSWGIKTGDSFKINPVDIDLYIGDAISTAGLDTEEKDGLTDRVYQWIKGKVEGEPGSGEAGKGNGEEQG